MTKSDLNQAAYAVSKEGTRIAYDTIGQGPAVILVGGAFSYRTFPGLQKLARLLASNFTTLAVGGAKSPAALREAVRQVGLAVPHGESRLLPGQNHNVSMDALAPVLKSFFLA
ncbi:hypothetical protein ACFSR7_05650 [Cohnella sp. GCM10020058]|uniref:hypothetical protein n=1 Tax=Cohnella sp. GCM10020058 TaxID=3317330 RepID=UPI0036280275